MTVFEILKEDHREIKDFLKEGEATSKGAVKTREKILATLKEKLQQHTKMEEEFFYPELAENDETRDLILESYEEHNLIDQLLAQLEKVDPSEEVWSAKFTVLKENIEHHAEEEEQELFPKARDVLSKDKLQEIAKKMTEFKK